MASNGKGEQQDRGRDTRSRLRQLALQLFAEQGYEKTSLREIAEQLGVTKAALYYHFRSKEDIVRSLIEDYVGELDELIAWAGVQPRTAATRAEIVRRYLRIVGGANEVFRMMHLNQATVGSLASAKDRGELFRERMDALIDLLTGPEARLYDQVRAASSLVSISYCCMRFEDRVSAHEDLERTLLEVALDLVDASPLVK